MYVAPGTRTADFKTLINRELLNTGCPELQFSISDDGQQLSCVEEAVAALGCCIEVAEPSGGEIVIIVTR